MRKSFIYIPLLLLTCLCFSCSTKKNTKLTRFYHSFTTRFNVYFNGNQAYLQAQKGEEGKTKESYSEIIPMYSVSLLPKDKEETGGPYDPAIVKCNKAIKLHSIKTKPKKQPGKSRDPKYKAFMAREEYNPFIHNAWLLMGRSQFYNGDFLQASATFSFIARHFRHDKNIVAEARLWMARCYAEMGWLYETEDILTKINNKDLPNKYVPLFSSVYADFLLKNNQHREAIPYLVKAINSEKRKKQKVRMQYLLGQLYAEDGNAQASYNTFQSVIRANPSFELEFNARIRQTEVYAEINPNKIIKKLGKMAKSDKNKEYLDQVYYALGNVYILQKDTVKAIENYELAIEKSTRNGIDKAICLVTLGDLFFGMKNYIKAQPCYTEALTIVNKEFKNYELIEKRSSVLDELVVHVEAVNLQDSLQRLAKMPEEERLVVINKIIEQVKKEEEEAKKQAEMENYLAMQEDKNAAALAEMEKNNQITTPTIPTIGGDNSWYFYNTQAVTAGKNDFQRRWGRRKLEDNWRRRNKTVNLFAEEQDSTETEQTDENLTAENTGGAGTGGTEPMPELSTDNKDPKFYLQQLPLTEEDIAASNAIIEDGLFNMGMIYKDKLEDFNLSIDAFNSLINRFPESTFLLEAYYQMWLIYMRQEDFANAEICKMKLIKAFPESDYAIALADPNYIQNMKNMGKAQEYLYQSTYNYYQASQVDSIRKNVELVKAKYPLSPLMPKFLFINALSYVLTNQPEEFKNSLKELVEKYPDADVTELAGEMLKGLLKGRRIVSDLAPITGMRWNLRFGDLDGEIDSTLTFSPETIDMHSVLLIYPAKSIHTNNLIYEVAAFNFGNFDRKQFDMSIEQMGDMRVLNISGFTSFEEAKSYDDLIYGDKGYARALPPTLFAVVISNTNYDVLKKGKTLEEYFEFFRNAYGNIAPEILQRWTRNINANNRLLDNDILSPEQPQITQPEETGKPEKQIIEPKQQEKDILPVQPENSEAITDTVEKTEKSPVAPAEFTEKEKATQNKQEKVTTVPQEDPKKEVEEEQNRLKQLQKDEKERIKAEKEAKKQKEEDKKKLIKKREQERKEQQKQREELQKQKEKERKEQQKIKEKERREKEKAYKEKMRQREKERKEQQKIKEQERKAKQKARELELKQKKKK
ncbi:MAG: tetratricopeptide repeat protein [Bacteroidales bacterium]|nr:tetratricopeptide repeat protein [Bacteroidales bacterium]